MFESVTTIMANRQTAGAGNEPTVRLDVGETFAPLDWYAFGLGTCQLLQTKHARGLHGAHDGKDILFKRDIPEGCDGEPDRRWTPSYSVMGLMIVLAEREF